MKEPTKTPKQCEWSREKTAALIALYQSHQCLWNNFIESYKNKDKRTKAIENICNRLKITKIDFGKKIHNLRNQFNAEMKKLEKRNESSTEVVRSRWEHYEALTFLKEVIAPRPGYSVTGPRKSEVKYQFSIVKEDDHLQNCNDIQESEDIEIQCEEAGEDHNRIQFSNEPVVSREEILESKYHRQSADEITTEEYIQVEPQQQVIIQHQKPQELFQTTSPITESRNVTTETTFVETLPPKKRARNENFEEPCRDQWDVFGQFVASEFRNLNTEMSRKKLKRKIMQVMLEVGEEDDGININISLN